MTQRKRRPPRSQPRIEVIRIGPHILPPAWQPLDWLVPQAGQQLYIHHGHTDPDDHSACGPLLFCCLLAVEKYQRLPNSPLAGLDNWRLMKGAEFVPFLQRGARMIYFIFCDPIRPEGLWAIGLEGETLRQVLFKQQPLEILLQYNQVKRLA